MRQICLLLIFLTINTVSFSQDKEIYSSELLDLGDGKIVGSTIAELGDFVSQEFKVEVPKAGEYYISAWINGGIDRNSEKPEYQFLINGIEAEKIKTDESSSNSVDLKEKKFDLNAGVNTITVSTRKPHCPNVEFIKVSSVKQKRQISSEKFDKYIDELSTYRLPDNYLELKKEAIDNELSGKRLKSTKSYDPLEDYKHEMDVDFRYTYYRLFYLYSGTTYTFETSGYYVDPVMYLFNFYTPNLYSWSSDDDSSGLNPKIRVTIPVTGYYYVLIRKYEGDFSPPGVCDFYFNNSLYQSNCAVSGTRVSCNTSSTETTNWFTANLTGDSWIFIEDQTGYYPGRIIAYNNNWSEESNFFWHLASRVCDNLGSVRGVIVSSNSSYYPTGNCDLYMNCKNSDIWKPMYGFPSLLPEDAIQSSPATSRYNCIAWSGGMTYGKIWPPVELLGKPWWVDGDPLKSFSNFYGNVPSVRYSGAMTYTRTGATSSNSVVDLWYNESDGEYTHASVRKPGDNHPHGYDFESKPGTNMRTFHPRHSLRNSLPGTYGNVNKYYRQTSGLKSAMILDESIARGFCVIENIEFSNSEKQLISKAIMGMPLNQHEELKTKYNKWKKTWEKPEISIHSNPFYYTKSDEYREFIEYCKKLGKASWPFIFDRYEQGDIFIAIALDELTLAEKNMYGK